MQVNAALFNFTFIGVEFFSGLTCVVTISVDDNGQSGIGGPLTATVTNCLYFLFLSVTAGERARLRDWR